MLTGEHLQAVQGLLNAAICYFYFYNYKKKKSHYLRLRQNLSYDVREKKMPLSSQLNTDSSPSGRRKCGSEGLGKLWKVVKAASPDGVWPSEAPDIKLSTRLQSRARADPTIVAFAALRNLPGHCCSFLYRPHRIHSTPLSLSSLEGGKEQAKRKLPRQERPRDVSRSQA